MLRRIYDKIYLRLWVKWRKFIGSDIELIEFVEIEVEYDDDGNIINAKRV